MKLSSSNTTHSPFTQDKVDRFEGVQNQRANLSASRIALDQKFPQMFSAEQIEARQRENGIPLQIPLLDQYLPWGGLPRNDMSLLVGEPGLGATSLLLKAAESAQKFEGGWVGWLSLPQAGTQLLPQQAALHGIDLQRLLLVSDFIEIPLFTRFLQEMMSSGLFALIYCPWPEKGLKPHQLIKLKRLCRVYQVSLVWGYPKEVVLSRRSSYLHEAQRSLFALVIEFEQNFLRVQKVSHRPGPWVCQRSLLYASLVPELRKGPPLIRQIG